MIFVICRLCGKSNGHLYGCAGIAELVIKDCPTVTGREMTVRPLTEMGTGKIVGFQWDIPFAEQGDAT